MKLKEIAKVQGGFAFKSDSFVSNETPIIRIGNIVNNEIVIDYDITAPISTIGDRKEFLVSKNDLLIAMSGATVGKVGIYNFDIPSMLNQRVGNIKSDEGYKKYIFYLLQSPQFKKYVELSSIGCAQPNISNSQIENFEFKENSIDEIKKIVKKLDNVNSLIDIRKNEIEKCNNLIKSQFVEMFENNKYEKIRLGDYINTVSGGTPSKVHNEYYENGNIPWLTSGEVNNGVINEVKNYITELGLKNSSAKLVPANSVVIAMYGATAGVVGLLKIKTSTNQAVCSLLPNDNFDPLFLYYAVKTNKEWMISQCKGGGQQNISQSIIRNMMIIKAPIELQNKFAEFVKQIDKQKFVVMKILSYVSKIRYL